MDKTSISKTTDSGALRPKAPLTVMPEKRAEIRTAETRPAPAATPVIAPPPVTPAPAPVRTVAPENREVKLELYQRNAGSVCVAGSFNNWNPQATPLKGSGTGKWDTTLALAPGKYEYRFVVDGKWIEDPLAKESVPNPFGGANSVLVVK